MYIETKNLSNLLTLAEYTYQVNHFDFHFEQGNHDDWTNGSFRNARLKRIALDKGEAFINAYNQAYLENCKGYYTQNPKWIYKSDNGEPYWILVDENFKAIG